MKLFEYLLSGLFMVIILYLYEKHKLYNLDSEEERNYKLVKKYLISDSSLATSKKPILWIYNEYELNSRDWQSFYSRSNERLNQPYIFLTIKSIIDRCGKDFNICMINDSSLINIIPDWNINMDSKPNPIKLKLRQIAKAKILKFYGGLFVPPTFICLKNLSNMYYNLTMNNKIVVGELKNKNITTNVQDTMVSNLFIGSRKNNRLIDEYIGYLNEVLSTDFTADSIFEGDTDRWLYSQVKKHRANKIDAKLLGVVDEAGKLIRTDNLISNSFIDFKDSALGIYIPQDELLSRTDYLWFTRMNVEQVVNSDTMIGKLLLINFNM